MRCGGWANGGGGGGPLSAPGECTGPRFSLGTRCFVASGVPVWVKSMGVGRVSGWMHAETLMQYGSVGQYICCKGAALVCSFRGQGN